jgi:hypothetical protein
VVAALSDLLKGMEGAPADGPGKADG